ncbi:MAG: tungstate ABC transporter substrate-binding protein WtpA [bacterium]|nr:tungstate ABC transporter substrate-binding protein WtpA [bacterium]
MLLIPALMLPGCAKREQTAELSGELVIFHAGSLSVPFRQLSAAFMERHPGVTVKAEAAGSRDCARKISDLGRPCDVMASADYTVVSTLLMPEHTDFNIRFVTNEMAIAYTPHSRKHDRFSAENWYEIMLSDDVAFGRADPNRDPCGYRSVMVMQLAERYYGVEGLARDLADKDGDKYIRPKETDLLALLEAGEIDYLFIYRSVAEQHNLEMLLLPNEVNLKSADLGDLYVGTTVKVTGKKPGEFITKRGSPMVYSVTIPKSAENRAAAEAYVAMLLSEQGRAIMEANGQPALHPAPTDGFDKLPASLKSFCSE